jgi:pSer/pThr/pTyr-binding forkhead associated (FHA) protein
MSLLRIYKNDVMISEVKLKQSKSYIVGRGHNCDITIEAEVGISRKHLKIFNEKGLWTVDCLSKFKELYVNGVKNSKIVLEHGHLFDVPPYRFMFVDEEQAQNPVKTESSRRKKSIESSFNESINERTVVVSQKQEILVKIANEMGQIFKVFRLEGQNWVAGRDTRSTIFIDVSEFSRQHFEIKYEDGNYMVRDLNSSNGTVLNRENLTPMQWNRLASGDTIEVVNYKVIFEIRDPDFKDKMKSVMAVEDVESSFHDASILDEPPPPVAYQPGMNYPSQYQASRRKKRKQPDNQWYVLFIGVVVIGLTLMYVLEDSGSSQKSDMASESGGRPQSAFDRLTAQQQRYVHDTYSLADQLFRQGKYQLAKQEVSKIHQLVPYYYESKNLEQLAEVALQTQIEQQKALAREEEKRESEIKIQNQVNICKTQIRPTTTMSDLEKCLDQVLVLNPEHPAILEAREQVERIMAEQAIKEEKQQAYEDRVQRQRNLFHKAETLFIDTQYLAAIKAYDVVVNSGLPDPDNLKSKAKRKIASIQDDLSTRQRKYEKDAEDYLKNGNLKEAILKMKASVEINPNNEVAKTKLSQMMGDLKRQMQAYYQEGILEESVGEVEAAKGKWKRILEKSLPEEEYYKKAKLKLKKYGL